MTEVLDFRWRCKSGLVLRLEEMETRHIFNAMKMLYNHLAVHYGLQPVWFQRQYSDVHQQAMLDSEQLAGVVMLFISEIERRGDLPDKYKVPYREIVTNILRSVARKMLPEPPIAVEWRE